VIFTQKYSKEEFLLVNNIRRAYRNTQRDAERDNYEPFQLFATRRGRLEGYFAGSLKDEATYYYYDIKTALFKFSEEVFNIVSKLVVERYPDYLDHVWYVDKAGDRRLFFLSPYREEAEKYFEEQLVNVANSGWVKIDEQLKRQRTIDPFFENEEEEEDFSDIPIDESKLDVTLKVKSVGQKQLDRVYDHFILGKHNLQVKHKEISFSYADLQKHICITNAHLLELLNAQDALDEVSEIDSELFDAIDVLDIERAVDLVKQGANINALNEFGSSPLTMLAAATRYANLPDELLEDNDFLRNNPDIAEDERIAMMQTLIDLGADVNHFGYGGVTALLHACYQREIKVIQFLLEKGANPNINYFGYSDEFSGARSVVLDMVMEDKFLALGSLESHKRIGVTWDYRNVKELRNDLRQLNRIIKILRKAGARIR
jgi:hypothetical protein